jgi:cation transport protein ChaC
MAYRVSASDWPETWAYLRDREQPTETYVEAWRPVKIDGVGPVDTLVFLSVPGHPQWAGALTLERQADLIDGASGLSGRNIDYLRDLVLHLREETVRDASMERLLAMVEAREGT